MYVHVNMIITQIEFKICIQVFARLIRIYNIINLHFLGI